MPFLLNNRYTHSVKDWDQKYYEIEFLGTI